MFVEDSLLDAYLFQIVIIFITAVIAVLVGSWLHNKSKDKK